ncbi:MAG TPA: hypothetical protein VL443_24175 [Cyclobacteriaceae bacterium]|jgi:hypothetical protein|nr:hypothetical protein [Cyclobacteriaceae bacterium]
MVYVILFLLLVAVIVYFIIKSSKKVDNEIKVFKQYRQSDVDEAMHFADSEYRIKIAQAKQIHFHPANKEQERKKNKDDIRSVPIRKEDDVPIISLPEQSIIINSMMNEDIPPHHHIEHHSDHGGGGSFGGGGSSDSWSDNSGSSDFSSSDSSSSDCGSSSND